MFLNLQTMSRMGGKKRRNERALNVFHMNVASDGMRVQAIIAPAAVSSVCYCLKVSIVQIMNCEWYLLLAIKTIYSDNVLIYQNGSHYNKYTKRKTVCNIKKFTKGVLIENQLSKAKSGQSRLYDTLHYLVNIDYMSFSII